MSDEQKKTGADSNDGEDSSKVVKKTASARKKTKAKSNAKEEISGKKNKVIEKLQAMGVMAGGGSDAVENKMSEKKGFSGILIASIVAVLVVGSFVWVLIEKTSHDHIASNVNGVQPVHSNPTHPSYPGSWQPSQNNNAGYPGYNPAAQENNYEENQQRIKQHQDQQQKWMQQQQKAQEQYRLQQHQWMQQQQQLRAKQRMQQQWMKEQQQRAQQQVQEQRAQQQQQPQQSYYNYPSYSGYQGQPVSPSYNYAPYYQQQGAYYGRQY